MRVSAFSRGAGALVGVLSALVALVVAELLALVAPGHPSALVGIANRIIDFTPANVREWLISVVGTNDKLLLSVGIVVVVLTTGGLLGARYRARPQAAWPTYLLLGLLVGLFAASETDPFWGIGCALVGATVGWGILVGMLRTKSVLGREGSDGDDDDTDVDATVAPALNRRSFLTAAGGLAALAAGGIAVIASAKQQSIYVVEKARTVLKLPKPVKLAPPLPPGAAVNAAGMPPPVTPNPDFYRIDVSLTPPAINVDTWSLKIGGRVDHPFTLTYADLLALPQVEQYVTLVCVSNEVGGDLVGNALWQGVPLKAILDRAGISNGAEQIVGEAVDGFTVAFPLQLALDGREPMIAVGMNGEPLPVEHGYPARLIVPGLYGYVSATKWLSEIRLTMYKEETPFWVDRGWVLDGRIQAASRFDVPRTRSKVQRGNVVVAGRAWHQNTPIGAVEVSVDFGQWQRAQLADSMGVECWRLWSWNWDASEGEHELRVRMIDENGRVQSEDEHGPGPGPSSGYASISISVEG